MLNKATLHPTELQGERILFACFDWGFGHVARSLALMQQLALTNEVLFAGSSEQVEWVQRYDLGISTVDLDGSHLKFSGSGNFFLEGLRNMFRAPKFIRRDQAMVKKLVQEHQPTFIVSDHRYGFYKKGIPSVFLTHQVQLPKDTSSVIQSVHRHMLYNFDAVWVMDDETLKLAGYLSDLPKNGQYIGHYSRFSMSASVTVEPNKVVLIISGPEPYGELLFRSVESVWKSSKLPLTVVSQQQFTTDLETITWVSDWKEADVCIQGADVILSRNGYSTLMDLLVLNKKALLLATPGQDEQWYLAELNRIEEVAQFTEESEFQETLKAFLCI